MDKPPIMIAIFLRTILIFNILCVSMPAHAAYKAMRIERRADELKKMLETLPYASEGRGPVIYIFEHPDCIPCKKLYLTFSGKELGVELRHIFFAEDESSAHAAAALAKTRSMDDYRALMDRNFRPPSYKTNDETRAALDAVMDPLRDTVLPIMKKNGWPVHGLEPPVYIWEQLGVMFMENGYDIERFVLIMKSTKLKLDDIPPEELLLMDGLPLKLAPLADTESPANTTPSDRPFVVPTPSQY